MTKTFNNFINKLKKLDNYFILREEDDYFIIGAKKLIKEHIEIHTTFSTHANNIDKDFWIFFILGLNENCLNEFKKKKLPVLILPKNISNSQWQRMIDDFIYEL